ncbi:MAG: acyl carrier protein [Halothiobacillaceae bacterium]|nr:MAG: acyl carrier protein [Halothiobacillaceae bacterium]
MIPAYSKLFGAPTLYSENLMDWVKIALSLYFNRSTRHTLQMDSLHITRQFLSEQYGIPPASVTPATALDEIGIDSLVFIDLVFEFEAKLGIQATNEEIADLKTVGELITLIDRLRLEKN